jgi:undecaprenyl diphosphate synthase
MSQQIPQHIAIIMDGNGRWAQSRGLVRSMGHRQGIEALKKTVKAAGTIGVQYLTLFGFSSENWSRPVEEVSELMRLLRMYLRAETAELHRNNIQLRIIGDRSAFAADIQKLIENAENLTRDNDGLVVTIALNYGGRHEILTAASAWAKMCVDKNIDPDLASAEEYFPGFLMTDGMPDPDLLIRTSGETRISNFLLWQCSYSEMIFTKTLWPDFGEVALQEAITEFNHRDRRYGGLQTEGAIDETGQGSIS